MFVFEINCNLLHANQKECFGGNPATVKLNLSKESLNFFVHFPDFGNKRKIGKYIAKKVEQIKKEKMKRKNKKMLCENTERKKNT